jgi:tetratricopeptide (TPR) repeat protein
MLLGFTPIQAQQREAESAWIQGNYDLARAEYERVLIADPNSARANFRMGVLLSREGKLDSALTLLARARAAAPADQDIRVAQAQVLAWNKRYREALLVYDSVLTVLPESHDAMLGRARTLAWCGRLDEAESAFQGVLAKDPLDRDARLGTAQVHAWKGDLKIAEQEYGTVLKRDPRDLEARVGLGYVYLWQGRERAAARQAKYALAINPNDKTSRELSRTIRGNTRSSLETSAHWSNDSDHNTSFWQSTAASSPVSSGASIFGSVNALETSDPVRQGTRVGGELGVLVAAGPVQLTGAAGARRLDAGSADPRTAATYRTQVRFRPTSSFSIGAGYSRVTFDEIASLIEQNLDMEVLEGGFDVRPLSGFTIYGGLGELWLSDGNQRWNVSAGITQKVLRHFFVGAFGRTLSYQDRGIGYFSPDRFSVGEGIAGYNLESGTWIGGVSGGAGAQQVGKGGAAQSEWHVEGRVGKRWGTGNSLELFGLITNSAVSSTTGAFRYGSAGMSFRLGM